MENTKKKLILHSCCAVCSSHVLSVLAPEYDLTVLYYNPNIFPQEEYEHRKREQIRLIQTADFCNNVRYMDLDYQHDEYLNAVRGLEKEKEGGLRCHVCYELRLDKTAEIGKENGFDLFCTTLTVSPYKNSEVINTLGEKIANKYGIEWLESNFKKKDGYLHSTQLAKEYQLYRQDFCGCEFAWRGHAQQTKESLQ